MVRIVALALPLLLGCRTPTQILVEVRTDVPCASVRGTTITVGRVGAIEDAGATSTAASCVDGRVGALVVAPSADKGAELAFRVVTGVGATADTCKAPSYKGCIVARRALRFVPHTELVVRVDMRGSCVDRPCDAQHTCVEGQCVENAIKDASSCAGGGCDEKSLVGGDAGVDAGDGATDAGDAGAPIEPFDLGGGLEAGSPWPLLNGTPARWGLTRYRLPKTNGKLWTAPGGGRTAPVVAADGTIYFGGDTGFSAVDPKTHASKWMLPSTGSFHDPAIAADGTIHVGSSLSTTLRAISPAGKVIGDATVDTLSDLAIGPGPIGYMAGVDGVVAVNLSTGKQTWSQPISAVPLGTTLTKAGKLYFGTAAGEVRQLDMTTGALGWLVALDNDIGAPIIAAGDAVYAATASKSVYALDTATGAQRWRTPLDGAVENAFARGVDGTLYVGTTAGTVYALEPIKGSVLWTSPGHGYLSAPLIVDPDGVMVGASGSGQIVALDGKSKGSVLWTYTAATTVVAMAPGGDGVLYALTYLGLEAIGP